MSLKEWVLGWAKGFGVDQTGLSAEPTQYSLQTVEVPGDFEFLAKGTSFRQDAIKALGLGPHQFVLTPERGNKHDKLAVMIQGINGSDTLHIGYLPMGSETQELAHELGLAMISKGAILTIDGEVQEGDSGLIVMIAMPGTDKFAELLSEYS
jgi:hypothetical protein